MAENYQYETKCRRCGRFEEYFFSTSDQVTKLDFFIAVNDYTVNPRQYFCKSCMKDTIQDVVSYSIENDDNLNKILQPPTLPVESKAKP